MTPPSFQLLDIGVFLAYGTVCSCVLIVRAGPNIESIAATKKDILLLVAATAIPCLTCRLGHFPWWVNLCFLTCPLIAVISFIMTSKRFNPTSHILNATSASVVMASTFLCPCVPLVPMLGIMLNVYLSCTLHTVAWIRLVVLSVILFVIYSYNEYRRFQNDTEKENNRDAGRNDDNTLLTEYLLKGIPKVKAPSRI